MQKYRHLHPFPLLAYEVTLACTDPQTGMLDFQYMYSQIHTLYKEGIIDDKTFTEYTGLGWQDNMKFKFFVPTVSEWEKMANTTMQIVAKKGGRDVYAKDILVYILTHKHMKGE